MALAIAKNSPAAQPVVHSARKASDSQVASNGRAEAAQPRRLSHRRTQSTPHNPQEGDAPPGQPLVTMGFDVAASAAAGASSAEPVAKPTAGTRQLVLHLRDGPSRGAGPAPGHPRTQSADLAAPADVAGYSPRSGIGRMNSVPALREAQEAAVTLTVRDDATLREVLTELSKRQAQTYDPVNFCFERPDGGIQLRLDPNMEVRQLGGNTVLNVVRKDAQATNPLQSFAPRDDRLSPSRADIRPRSKDSVRSRPPTSQWFFTEQSVSTPKQYKVAVRVQTSSSSGSSSGRLGGGPHLDCLLTVDRERLSHVPGGQGGNVRTPSFDSVGKTRTIMNVFKKLVSSSEASRPAESIIFNDRRVASIQTVSLDSRSNRAFIINWQAASSQSVDMAASQLHYTAEDASQCAECVARIKFIQSLLTAGRSLADTY